MNKRQRKKSIKMPNTWDGCDINFAKRKYQHHRRLYVAQRRAEEAETDWYSKYIKYIEDPSVPVKDAAEAVFAYLMSGWMSAITSVAMLQADRWLCMTYSDRYREITKLVLTKLIKMGYVARAYKQGHYNPEDELEDFVGIRIYVRGWADTSKINISLMESDIKKNIEEIIPSTELF